MSASPSVFAVFSESREGCSTQWNREGVENRGHASVSEHAGLTAWLTVTLCLVRRLRRAKAEGGGKRAVERRDFDRRQGAYGAAAFASPTFAPVTPC